MPDRRSALLLLLATMTPGCAQARSRAPGDLLGFRRRFVDPSGRVVDTGNCGISHSEGQGYAMLLAEADGDRPGYDRIWGWTRETLRRPDGLFAWRYDPRKARPVDDPNNATDGDLLIAWALLRAGRRWPGGGYGEAAGTIAAAIAGKLIVTHGERAVLLPGLTGFVDGGGLTLNPSYYVWPALDAFARAYGGAWRRIVADGEALIAQARFGTSGLPTDWVDLGADGRIAPAAGRPPRFGFDAIRVPLYLAWSRRRAALRPFAAFWSPYVAAGRPIPAWIDVVTGETAPFPLSPGGEAVVRLAVPAARERAGAVHDGDYYATVLAALSRLAAAGGPAR